MPKQNLDPNTSDVVQSVPGITLLHTLRPKKGWIGRIAWSPEGDLLAYGLEDATIEIWDRKKAKTVFTLRGHTHWISSVSWSPTGMMLASASQGDEIRIWDLKTGREIKKLIGHTGSVNCVAWSPDGTMIASGSFDRTVRVWDFESGKELMKFTGHIYPIFCLLWSPDQLLLLSGSQDNTTKVWDIEKRTLRSNFENAGEVFCLSWAPGDDIFAAGSEDGAIRLWNLEKKHSIERFEGHNGGVNSIDFSRDRLLLASKSQDGTVRIWRYDTKETISILTERSSGKWLPSLAFNPIGLILATLGEEDTVIRIWEFNIDKLIPEASTKGRYELGGVPGACSELMPREDQLGFKNYIEAFADLIQSIHTKPPLTIGIYGSWGTGKSFLMEQIGQKLESNNKPSLSAKDKLAIWLKFKAPNIYKPPRSEANVYVVRFNAWTYSSSIVIWPGLVKTIMKDIEKKLFTNYFDLNRSRFNRIIYKIKRNKSNIFKIAFAQLPIFIIIVLIFYIALSSGQKSWAAFISLGVTSFLTIVYNFSQILSNPFGEWVKTAFSENDYGKQIGYMEEIRGDLKFLKDELGDNRILVIIDDLDRCEPGKAVEVLQAINLLLNFESFIVMLGIDSRVITCAIEEYYKNLLGPAGASGYEYLEKIVQIPFRIPEPNDNEIKEFIKKLLEESESDKKMNPEAKEGEMAKETSSNNKMPSAGVASDQTLVNINGKTPTKIDKKLDQPPVIGRKNNSLKNYLIYNMDKAFEDPEKNAFIELSDFVRHNPRHIKRLVNIYLLVRALAKYEQTATILRMPKIVIYWLIICGQWPYTMSLMLDKFSKMVRENKINLDDPPKKDPLVTLYNIAISSEEFSPKKQKIFDYDPYLLASLLDKGRYRLDWKSLRIIMHYTVNFNPAIETELKFTERNDDSNPVQSECWADLI
jgi:hypothetical protein